MFYVKRIHKVYINYVIFIVIPLRERGHFLLCHQKGHGWVLVYYAPVFDEVFWLIGSSSSAKHSFCVNPKINT